MKENILKNNNKKKTIVDTFKKNKNKESVYERIKNKFLNHQEEEELKAAEESVIQDVQESNQEQEINNGASEDSQDKASEETIKEPKYTESISKIFL